jgi:hypothetical protein
VRLPSGLEGQIEETLAYLKSPAALASLSQDPYWPKWESPWWRMQLLLELGLEKHIPPEPLQALMASIGRSYLTFFPTTPSQIPPGADPYRDIGCHCALGSAYMLLAATGQDVDGRLPWIRPWFILYQMADGGLNCDETAYTRPVPRSSVVSTLPPLEAILYRASRPLSEKEDAFLDRGAEYLIRRRLVRSISRGGAVIDESWTRPAFPRFYHYDILRGYRFLSRWAEYRKTELPSEVIMEVRQHLPEKILGAPPAWLQDTTLRQDARGEWQRHAPSQTFPLLEAVVRDAKAVLNEEWQEFR